MGWKQCKCGCDRQGEGAAVCLLGDRFQQGAWIWLVSSCTLSDISNMVPTNYYFVDLLNSEAWMSAPMCMCDCWLISTANCIQFKSIFWSNWFIITTLIIGVMILYFVFFFPLKEILKNGILTTAENFVNTNMEGGFRKEKNFKKEKEEKKKYILQRTKN